MRIEANNLQEAFQKAAAELNCSVTELDIKVIQNPSAGFLGFFKKTAIIEAVKESKKEDRDGSKFDKKHKKERSETKEPRVQNQNESSEIRAQKDEKTAHKFEKPNDKPNDKKRNKNKKRNHENSDDRQSQNLSRKEPKSYSKSASNASVLNISDDAFKFDEAERTDNLQVEITEPKPKIGRESTKNILDNSILDTFHKSDFEETTEVKNPSENKVRETKPKVDIDKILPEIRENLTALLNASSFAIGKIEVSKFNDECVLIELDGDDAALLIGKEGYRYKALSYMIYNWINSKYGVSVRFEIAEFLKNQEAAMDEYLKGVIERVQTSKKTKTKPLDGILVKIALEKLRDKFPDKYVGIKSDGDKQFVVINDFVKKT